MSFVRLTILAPVGIEVNGGGEAMWLDLKLIPLSFWMTFCGKREHRGRKF